MRDSCIVSDPLVEIHKKCIYSWKRGHRNNSHEHRLSMVHSNDKKKALGPGDRIERWAVGKKDEEFAGGQIKKGIKDMV